MSLKTTFTDTGSRRLMVFHGRGVVGLERPGQPPLIFTAAMARQLADELTRRAAAATGVDRAGIAGETFDHAAEPRVELRSARRPHPDDGGGVA